MKLKKLYLKSFMVTLILIMLGTAIIGPQLGLAQENQPGEDQEPDQVETSSTEDPTSLTDHPLGLLFEIDLDDKDPPKDDEGESPPFQLNNFDDVNNEALPSNTIILDGMDAERDILSGSRAPGVLVIPTADFRSDGFSPSGFSFSFSGGYLNGSSSNPCLMAPVYLPQGVAINQIFATVMDNSATQRVWVRLYRLDNFTGSVSEIALIETTNAFESQSLHIIGATGLNTSVLYPDYSYYIGTCLSGSSIRLYSIRIYYDL